MGLRECDKQEIRVCKALGGQRQLGSGATPFLKGDGVLEDLLIECKTKNSLSKSFSIKSEWLEKLKDQSYQMRKEGGLLVFSFCDGKDYVVDELNNFADKYKSYRKYRQIEDILLNNDKVDIETIREIILKE
ncbi:MAG: hypothetical protein ACRDBY_14235 [Cetobacterium sp.]